MPINSGIFYFDSNALPPRLANVFSMFHNSSGIWDMGGNGYLAHIVKPSVISSSPVHGDGIWLGMDIDTILMLLDPCPKGILTFDVRLKKFGVLYYWLNT
ncbi:hypothetical protein VTK73DRAFT_9401 [Phialemonium thermophilum]|uniref:Uncharacterized protein n=1 Tax=Phialemonium thermophilum TaxID=223376 RepID=A0ABR3XKW8_9PEZI